MTSQPNQTFLPNAIFARFEGLGKSDEELNGVLNILEIDHFAGGMHVAKRDG